MPVQVTNIKAADPGVGFTLEVTAPDVSVNNSLRAVVTLTNPTAPAQDSFVSEIWVKNRIEKDQTMKLLAPFGDNAYQPGLVMQFNIELYMPFDTLQPTVVEQGQVMATAGRFNLGSSMIVKVEELNRGGKRPATDGMPMMVSEDGEYVGILSQDGNFSIYPQYTFGADKKLEATYTSNTQDVPRIGKASVYIELYGGQVHFMSTSHPLFISEQKLEETDVYLVIRKNGFYLIKPSTLYEPGATVGPLTFKKVE